MVRLLLHDIRSHYNVGAIFRTADGAGVAHVYCSGVTPRPKDRFGRSVPEIHKTALGAEEFVAWSGVETPIEFLRTERSRGTTVVAIEQAPNAVSLLTCTPPDNVLYIFGSETEGLPQAILDEVDKVVDIPMRGKKESLNVSVAVGIVLYHT